MRRFGYTTATAAITIFIASMTTGPAHADIIQTYNLTGILVDGASLSGNLMIDETIGVVTAGDLIVSAPESLTFTVVQAQLGGFPVAGDYQVDFATATNPTGLPNLDIVFPVSSLVGYSGGKLESHDAPVNGVSSALVPATGSEIGFQQGALTAAPEPTSVALLAVGLAGVGAARRRKAA